LDVSGGLERIARKENGQNLYCTSNIFRIIKPRMMRQADNIEHMGHTENERLYRKNYKKETTG
jgi:hypothetical protein